MSKGRVGLALTLAAASIVGLLVASGAFAPPSVERARRSYDRGDWPAAASVAGRVLDREPDNAEAARLRSRALARLGDAAGSARLLDKFGGANAGAEDLFLIGEGAGRDGRLGLTRLAVEAALRLDPKQPGASEALDQFKAAFPSSYRVDRPLAAPDSAALAELIVGLAATPPEGSRSSEIDPAFARLLTRDRPAFLKLASPADARKLLARVFLEAGRAGPARERLGPLADPESLGLLGRAALLQGDRARAKAELDRTGPVDPMALEPSRYVGAARCAGCHSEIYRAQQSSRHSATIASGAALEAVPLPEGAVDDPGNPAVVHRFDRSGETVRVVSKGAGVDVAGVVDYALGSGHHGVTMLSVDPDGRHRSMRISYYARGRHWGLTSGFEPRPVDPKAYLGEPLNEASFQSCLNCHTTRFAPDLGPPGPEASDRGIGCERCHGPGDLHVRAVAAGLDTPLIARPRLATPAARLKLCAQCHGSDGVIPPSDPRFIRFQAATLSYSRCVSETGGKLDCVACHDPHRDVETSPSYYNARCLACHAAPGAAKAPGLRVEAVAASRCPVDPVGGCVGCHMPKVEDVMPHMSFTDHHIRPHRPAATKTVGAAR